MVNRKYLNHIGPQFRDVCMFGGWDCDTQHRILSSPHISALLPASPNIPSGERNGIKQSKINSFRTLSQTLLLNKMIMTAINNHDVYLLLRRSLDVHS